MMTDPLTFSHAILDLLMVYILIHGPCRTLTVTVTVTSGSLRQVRLHNFVSPA